MLNPDELPESALPPGAPFGLACNDGNQRYLLEAESTTGYVAWRMDDGTTLVSTAMQVSLAASASVRFWSCAGYQDTSPAGAILAFDCHGNGLTQLDVTRLRSLEYLDCSFNSLAELDLSGLLELQALDVDDNQLTRLSVRHLRKLRVRNCAHNRLQQLDLSGMDVLEVLDCVGNPLRSVVVEGCVSLRDARTVGPGS